jgi:hypothetical protein
LSAGLLLSRVDPTQDPERARFTRPLARGSPAFEPLLDRRPRVGVLPLSEIKRTYQERQQICRFRSVFTDLFFS